MMTNAELCLLCVYCFVICLFVDRIPKALWVNFDEIFDTVKKRLDIWVIWVESKIFLSF